MQSGSRFHAFAWNKMGTHIVGVGGSGAGRSCSSVWAQGESCLIVNHPPGMLKVNTWPDEVAEEAPERCNLAACLYAAKARNSTPHVGDCPGVCPSWQFAQHVSDVSPVMAGSQSGSCAPSSGRGCLWACLLEDLAFWVLGKTFTFHCYP